MPSESFVQSLPRRRFLVGDDGVLGVVSFFSGVSAEKFSLSSRLADVGIVVVSDCQIGETTA
jgi:hypothetical protein